MRLPPKNRTLFSPSFLWSLSTNLLSHVFLFPFYITTLFYSISIHAKVDAKCPELSHELRRRAPGLHPSTLLRVQDPQQQSQQLLHQSTLHSSRRPDPTPTVDRASGSAGSGSAAAAAAAATTTTTAVAPVTAVAETATTTTSPAPVSAAVVTRASHPAVPPSSSSSAANEEVAGVALQAAADVDAAAVALREARTALGEFTNMETEADVDTSTNPATLSEDAGPAAAIAVTAPAAGSSTLGGAPRVTSEEKSTEATAAAGGGGGGGGGGAQTPPHELGRKTPVRKSPAATCSKEKAKAKASPSGSQPRSSSSKSNNKGSAMPRAIASPFTV